MRLEPILLEMYLGKMKVCLKLYENEKNSQEKNCPY